MNAGQVLRQLIHALLRLELVHQSGVAVAPGARAGNRRAGDFAHKPLCPAHGQRGIFLCGITAMTGGATEADPRVHVAGEFQSGLCQRAVQGGLTLAAGVPARRAGQLLLRRHAPAPGIRPRGGAAAPIPLARSNRRNRCGRRTRFAGSRCDTEPCSSGKCTWPRRRATRFRSRGSTTPAWSRTSRCGHYSERSGKPP